MLAPAIPGFSQPAGLGKVLYVSGDARKIVDGVETKLTKRDELSAPVRLVVGDKARVQIMCVDGARISLRSNTDISFHKYLLPGPKSQALATGTARGEVRMHLQRGSFRTISGAINKHQESVVSITTPSIEILRITGDARVQHCSDNKCPDPSGAAHFEGTYLSANSGEVLIRTGSSLTALHTGAHAYSKHIGSPLVYMQK